MARYLQLKNSDSTGRQTTPSAPTAQNSLHRIELVDGNDVDRATFKTEIAKGALVFIFFQRDHLIPAPAEDIDRTHLDARTAPRLATLRHNLNVDE